MKYVLTFCIFFQWCLSLQAQEVFIEKLDSTKVQLYFNDRYFLVDKNCEFYTIRRETGFSVARRQFEGEFTDYDRKGKIVLTGAYRQGKKNGAFKGFFANGYLQWNGKYADGRPEGTWYYYYSDGNPWIILEYYDDRVLIKELWDLKGKQVVKQGNGKFELEDPVYEFNEKGTRAMSYKGKLENGLPDGVWVIEHLFGKGSADYAAAENFVNGKLVTAVNEFGAPYSRSAVRFTPIQYHSNAEQLISLNCSIDDQVDYTDYLHRLLSRRLLFERFNVDQQPGDIEVSLKVDTRGRSSNINAKTPFGPEADKMLERLIGQIVYWIPSQKDGKAITDTLNIRLTFFVNASGVPQLASPVITRVNGK